MPLKLSKEQYVHWHKRGWLALREAISSDEVSRIRDCVAAVAQPPQAGERRMHHFEETARGPAICRTERFIEDHAELRSFITEGLPATLVAGLSGQPMLVYKEKINYKEPGGAGFAPHQDVTAYPHVDFYVTALVPIDPMTPENGCLEVASFGAQERLPSDGRGCLPPEAFESLSWEPQPLVPGDVLFFTSYVPHRSGPNRTTTGRRALYLTYNRAADGDLRTRYYAERDRHFAADARHRDGISLIRHFQGTAVQETK